MNFFKAVFAEDSDHSDAEENQRPVSESHQRSSKDEEEQEGGDYDEEAPLKEHDSDNPNPNPNTSPKASGGSAWSFGGLIQTLSTKSESVLQTYRRDLEEFRSGLKKESEVIREVASRAVKDLPVSLEVGASVAQESLESVGQAIDEIGSSVWRGTSEFISHGKEILAADPESDSSDSQQLSNSNLNSKRYNRFEAQVQAIQTDVNTYCEEPEDLDEFNNWKSGFILQEKAEEIENLGGENGVMEGIYMKLVPNAVDHETFWIRYFYRVYKLKQVEDARAKLVKRAISADEDEDLSWDVDDDDEDETTGVADVKVDRSEEKELEKECASEIAPEKKAVEEQPVSSSDKTTERSSMGEINNMDQVMDNENGSNRILSKERHDPSGSGLDGDDSITKLVEGKNESGESSKDSDFSVVSSQPSLPEEEEEDLGWDEIEDLGSNDEKKESDRRSPSRADLHKRLSAAEEDEDLSWDIDDDDEPMKH